MPRPIDWDAIHAEQVAYYRARAPEYDQWWNRQGDYDLGEEFNRVWRAEVAGLDAALERFAPAGQVLEVAAGTGIWTHRLSRYSTEITALDTAPEALAINRSRLAGSNPPVRYIEADVFSWQPDRRFDVVSFAFWLTHVPPPRFDRFWSLVQDALRPDGRVFFVDNAPPRPELPVLGRRFACDGHQVEGIHSRTDLDLGVSVRRVHDGRRFQTIKVYWSPEDLQQRLRDLGWRAQVESTDWAFIYGHGTRASSGTGA